MNVKKILMPTDFSECSNRALNHALFLAEHLEADLDLLHVIVLHEFGMDVRGGFPDADDFYRRLQDVAASEMKAFLKDRKTDHLKIRESERRGVAAGPAIVEYAEENGIDLIVVGAHGRRGFRRLLLGSVAEEVVRLAPCPVLTIRGVGEAPELHPPRNILVPYDFSHHAKAAFDSATNMAKSYGGKLCLIHIIEPVLAPHPYVPVHYFPEGTNMPELLARVRENLEKVAEEAVTAGVECDIEVFEGDPAWAIAEHARDNETDLIVIATHGRTGLSHFFLGSVTEKVVRGAECPVLTLKIDAEATD